MENFNKKLNLNLDTDFLVHTIPPRILHDPVGDLQGAQTAALQSRCFMVLKKNKNHKERHKTELPYLIFA